MNKGVKRIYSNQFVDGKLFSSKTRIMFELSQNAGFHRENMNITLSSSSRYSLLNSMILIQVDDRRIEIHQLTLYARQIFRVDEREKVLVVPLFGIDTQNSID